MTFDAKIRYQKCNLCLCFRYQQLHDVTGQQLAESRYALFAYLVLMVAEKG